MMIKPVKQEALFRQMQLFMLDTLLKESENNNLTKNEKLSEYIKNYSESFRDLWLKYED